MVNYQQASGRIGHRVALVKLFGRRGKYCRLGKWDGDFLEHGWEGRKLNNAGGELSSTAHPLSSALPSRRHAP